MYRSCCPLRRTPFSNFVRMHTGSLVPRPQTTFCLGSTRVFWVALIIKGSLEPRLSVPDFVSQLWNPIFLRSCETKSGTESLGSRLHQGYLAVYTPTRVSVHARRVSHASVRSPDVILRRSFNRPSTALAVIEARLLITWRCTTLLTTRRVNAANDYIMHDPTYRFSVSLSLQSFIYRPWQLTGPHVMLQTSPCLYS